MNSGEAADQVVRLTMEGAEFALKLAGEGAERILALLIAAVQPSPNKAQKQTTTKLRGKERLRTMLKSGAELKFFEIQGKDLKEFAGAAKRYGLAYCVLRQKNKPDGMVEIMAKAEDTARIGRILEKLEAHDLGKGTCEAVQTNPKRRSRRRADKDTASAVPEQSVPAQVAPPAQEGRAQPEAPAAVRPEERAARPPARTEPVRANAPSAPSSQTSLQGGGTFSERKPSVKDFLEDAMARKRREQSTSAKPRQQGKQRKHKSKKSKKRTERA